MIRRLFELEVPEIEDETVLIKSVAREAGHRSKIAVSSAEERVDPVGACVGHRGARVQAVVNELYGEKIDIIRWHENAAEFIREALSPAKAVSVTLNEELKSAYVIVPDAMLSLAIGKEGQNVRLAARLTGWRIDIRSETQDRDRKLEELAVRDTERQNAEDARAAILAEVSAEEADDEELLVGAGVSTDAEAGPDDEAGSAEQA
jgi:N utilization substance protein A